jgi:hypothetical protein
MRLFLSDSEDELARLEAQVLSLESHPDDARPSTRCFASPHAEGQRLDPRARSASRSWRITLEDLLDACERAGP